MSDASKSLLDATHPQTHARRPPSRRSWSVQMVWNGSKYLTSWVTLGSSPSRRERTFQSPEQRMLQCDMLWRRDIFPRWSRRRWGYRWTSAVFFRPDALLGWLHLAVTICYIPQSRVASARSLCLILLSPPVPFYPLFFLFLISPLECDLWWPWPALFGILHTWRDLNRAQGPFHKGHALL